MLIMIEENPNCEAVDNRLFQEHAPARAITHVRREGVWCPVTGLEEGMSPSPAFAQKVEDSGDGSCYLIFGGGWGLRLKRAESPDPWTLENPAQWGEPFLLLPADGTDLRFK